MVAITGGQGLGVNLGLTGVLGDRELPGQPQVGRNGQRVYVNGSSGNLVVQTQDEQLFDHGLDLGVLRTYNSQGQFDGVTGNSAGIGLYVKRVELTGGELGSDGSTLRRTNRDGSQVTYRMQGESQRYLPDEAGAGGSIGIVDGKLVWYSADGGLEEIYDAGSGRLQAAVDAGGYRIDYAYNEAGLLESVISDGGEAVYYEYAGSNLASIRTHIQDADGSWRDQTRVRYEYDSLNRLTGVVIDLSPQDNSVADRQVYRTDYRYDGNSQRLASIGQSDGSLLTFSYVEQDGVFRIASVSEGSASNPDGSYNVATDFADGTRRSQQFEYQPDAGYTLYTDPLGRQTRFSYDGAGSIGSISGPGGTADVQIGYDGSGQVTSVRDRDGNTTTMRYDGEGRLTYRATPDGGSTQWTYDENGDLLSETVWDGASMSTTHYYYAPSPADSGMHGLLRFQVSPAGRVTEYRYDAHGQMVTSLAYANLTLDPAQLSDGMDTDRIAAMLAQATPASSTAGATRRDVERTDKFYDAHGQLARVVRYAQVLTDAQSTGVADGALETRYVYDQGGRLLSSIDGTSAATTYAYDGLGRVLSVSTGGVATSVTLYDDAGHRTVVTDANGASTVSVYDQAGRLVALTRQGLGTTRYYYDALGRQRMSEDPSGARSWTYYDAAGNKAAEVDAAGRLREYAYDADGNQTSSVLYAAIVDVSGLVDAQGVPRDLDLAALRPARSPADVHEWRTWDAAGRQVHLIDNTGKLTQTSYDAAGRVLATTIFATTLDTSGLPAVLTPSMVVPRSAAGDRTTRNFYDADGLLQASLDADGKLTQYFHDGAGKLTEARAYAIAVNPALRAAGSLSQITTGLKTDDDVRTLYKYDGTGARIATSTVQGYPEDAPPGVREIDGTISQPGERDIYEFTLAGKSRLFFDGVQGDLTQWSLTIGSSTVMSSRDLTGTGDRSLELGSGTYRLTVDGVGDHTGDYRFRLLGVEAAQPLTVNQATTGSLQPAIGRDGKFQTNVGRGDFLTWVNAYNAPHWMGIGHQMGTGVLSKWVNTQTLKKTSHTDVEIYGTSWMRDLMAGTSFAGASLNSSAQFVFNGGVDANQGRHSLHACNARCRDGVRPGP